ncbi:hypothetical protein DY218_05730 [Streptomyces triticagri]|uniref:Uncharacterized protein n=1 Tax=Streptomyces triticagri TaxID=2293568 RepID=A0A372MBI1_9ACTN|nr:hypothetical protein [Streptomyces triticagri]RFU87753.1 hypothetical protein DY218_05730 [Streptomyces triticagri]
MFGTSKAAPSLTVLRDVDEMAAAIQQALADASPEDRPGLKRAAELLAAEQQLTEAEVRTRWVRRTLSEAGVDPEADHVAAVKALRQATPNGLRLLDAHTLVKEAAAAVSPHSPRP